MIATNGTGGVDVDATDDKGSGTHPAASAASTSTVALTASTTGGAPPLPPLPLLPRYLSPLVRHHHGEFYISRSFDPRLIAQLMSEGFLPIAASVGSSTSTRGGRDDYYLLPKLHDERCLVRLGPPPPSMSSSSMSSSSTSSLRISRSTRRKSGRFDIGVNERFDEVVSGCHRQQ